MLDKLFGYFVANLLAEFRDPHGLRYLGPAVTKATNNSALPVVWLVGFLQLNRVDVVVQPPAVVLLVASGPRYLVKAVLNGMANGPLQAQHVPRLAERADDESMRVAAAEQLVGQRAHL